MRSAVGRPLGRLTGALATHPVLVNFPSCQSPGLSLYQQQRVQRQDKARTRQQRCTDLLPGCSQTTSLPVVECQWRNYKISALLILMLWCFDKVLIMNQWAGLVKSEMI